MTENLYATLRRGFEARIGEVFLRLADGSTVTFAEIDEASARIATVLVDAGLRPEDRLVAQVGKSPTAVALYLACLRSGAVYVPLNEAYTADEVTYFLDDAEPRVVVFGPDRSLPDGSTATLFTLDGAGRGSLSDAAAEVRETCGDLVDMGSEPVAMLYTSGTTGKPKGAMLTTQNLRSNASTLTSIWGFTSDDVLIHALPIFHVHGLFIALHCALLSACEVRFLDRFDVGEVRRQMADATAMMGVPTFYSRLLADPSFSMDDCATMRLFISGSAPMTEALHEAFTDRAGHRILERYGMTETGMITSNPLDGERIAGTVGFALPDVEIRVNADNGRPCATGEVGVVEVRGPNVFAGYRGMPDKTAAAFRPDGQGAEPWFVTGDLGSVDDAGRLTLSGRGTDLIISGGLNIYPKEIELVLDEIDGVVESAVIGVAHADLGDGAVAVIVAGDDFDVASVAAALEGRLARFKHPRHIAVVDALPRNAMGKVEKAVLRRTYANVFD